MDKVINFVFSMGLVSVFFFCFLMNWVYLKIYSVEYYYNICLVVYFCEINENLMLLYFVF